MEAKNGSYYKVISESCRDTGKEKKATIRFYKGLYRGSVRTMEKNMEATIVLFRGFYWGCIGIMLRP